MKSILFVYHASNIGGGTYCLLNILKAIDRTKYLPMVLLCKDGDLVREIKKLDIEVYYFPQMTLFPYNKPVWNRGYFRGWVKRTRSLKKFRECVKNLNVDAVYFNTMMLAPYLKEAKSLGLRTCIHLREHWPLEEHRIQLRYLQKTIAEYADEIVAINSYSASMVPSRKATIVYDWIDMTGRYKDMPLSDVFGEDVSALNVYLFTGGIQVVKGTYEMVKIFRERIKGDDKRLLLVGATEPTPRGVTGKIKYVLSKLGIDSYEYKTFKEIRKDPRIKCIPAVYELSHLMQQVYCNLSFFTIPHANLALAESIIEGCIPVAACTPESVEYSLEGELAVLYNLKDADDMICKLEYLDDNYDTIKEKINHNREIIIKMFSPSVNADRLDSVYAKLFKTT